MATLQLYPACESTYTRVCEDGTGVVIGKVCAGEFFSPISQDDANALACELARTRALRKLLTCNNLGPSDIAGCGNSAERPQPTQPTALCLQTQLGNCLLTDEGETILIS